MSFLLFVEQTNLLERLVEQIMAKSKDLKTVNITNKKAKFEYFFVDTYEAGIVLQGTEIKSIRLSQANLNDAYCLFVNGTLMLKSMYVGQYDHGTQNNHKPRQDRKLLLHKRELKKISRKVREKGFTIVPYRLYISERGFAKVEIALAQGKKTFDKRNVIKDRENKRNLDRIKKIQL